MTAPPGQPPWRGDGAPAPAVVTPDAVALDLEVATVGSRAAAYLLDLLLLAVGFLLLGIAEAVFGFGGFVPDWFAIALVLLLLFAWQFGYPVGLETLWRGRTVGKAAMGLRVLTVEGGPVGFRHATIRAAVGLFELTATLGAGAVITSFASSRGQRLGDLAAGTLVVRERRAAGDPRAEVFQPPPGLEGYVQRLDVSGLGPGDYAAVRDTLRRSPQLPSDTRSRVTHQLAQALSSRVTPPAPAGLTAEGWLSCVAAAVQARRAPVATWRPSSPAAPDPAHHPPPPAPFPTGDAPTAGTDRRPVDERRDPLPRPSGGFAPPD